MTCRDQKTQIDMAVLDFCKAFDTVPHDRLLGKLAFYSITGPVLNWTTAFLKTESRELLLIGSSQKLQQWTQECPKGQSWVHCCSYFILMTCPMSSIRKFGCLRKIASCIGPYVPWRTRSCSSRTCLPWSAGAIQGACALTRLNATLCAYPVAATP